MFSKLKRRFKRKKMMDSRRSYYLGKRSKSQNDAIIKKASEYSTSEYGAYLEIFEFARKVVEIPLEDVMQTGATIKIDSDDKELKARIEKKYSEINEKIMEAWENARIAGNGGILLVTNDDDMELPLNFNRLQDGIVNVIAFKNDEIIKTEIEDDITSKNFGKARKYLLTKWRNNFTVHSSRFITFFGDRKTSDDYYDLDGVSSLKKCMSVLEQNHDLIKNVGALVKKSNVDKLGVPDFFEKKCELFENREMEIEQGYSVDDFINDSKALLSNENILVTDENITLNRDTINFTGLTQISDSYIETIAALEDIPVERFASKTQASLNNTGGNNKENYASKLRAMQNRQLQPCYNRLDEILSISYNTTIETTCNNPNEQSESEKVALETAIVNNAVALMNSGISDVEQIKEYFEGHKITELENITASYDV